MLPRKRILVFAAALLVFVAFNFRVVFEFHGSGALSQNLQKPQPQPQPQPPPPAVPVYVQQGPPSAVTKLEVNAASPSAAPRAAAASSSSSFSSKSLESPRAVVAGIDVDQDGYRVKHDQSWYRPHTGGYWKLRPKASEALHAYARRAAATASGGSNALKGFAYLLPNAEMGNQLVAGMSAFLFAFVTDRYWGVQSNGNYMANTQTYTRIWDTSAAGFQWWLPSLNGVSVPAASKTLVNKNDAYDASPDVFQAENFFCGDLNALYGSHASVGMNVNQYFAPSILRNPHYREKLKDIFGDDYFGPVSRFLLAPSAGTSKLADDFRRTHMDGKFVVGMHIRVSGGWGLVGDPDEWMELFAKAARAANTKDTNPKQRQVVWFIAVDQDPKKKEFMAKYTHEPGVVVVSTESVFGRDIPTLMETAFADMLILAECDKIISSSFSTYSYTAHGMASNPPIVITQAQFSHQQRVDAASAAKGPEILQFGVNLWSNQRTTFAQVKTPNPDPNPNPKPETPNPSRRARPASLAFIFISIGGRRMLHVFSLPSLTLSTSTASARVRWVGGMQETKPKPRNRLHQSKVHRRLCSVSVAKRAPVSRHAERWIECM